MVNLLRRLFIKDYNNTKNENVRIAHAKLAAIFGIITNVILFISKAIIGILIRSASILADSINNLSDTSSSVVTLIGFNLSKKPADKDHPFGHQRIEYITGLIISIFIIFIGCVSIFQSIRKVVNYKQEDVNELLYYISIGILAFAIILKIIQAIVYKKISKIISSVALKAAYQDSFNDVLTTFAVLIGMVTILLLNINNVKVPFSIDGILGIIVGLFVIISGIKLMKEEMDPLIGQYIDKDYAKEISDYIESFAICLGTHDLLCHLYGPTKCYISIHVEVDSSKSLIEVHNAIDEIEHMVKEKFNVILTIHPDPIDINDRKLSRIKTILEEGLHKIDSNLKFHDLRITKEDDKEIIELDLEVPFDYPMNEKEINELVNNIINEDNKYIIRINIDNPIIG